jgi:exonuclease SbcD
MRPTLRILLLADTHMGLDLALRPRVERRRRGLDFLANMRRALEPALNGEADIVVHGGDLLDRSRLPTAVVEMALEPLLEVARAGVPVFLVPGNHERSRIPLHLWTAHPNLHIFHEPGTFVMQVRDCRVALSGFPFDRQARTTFAQRVAETGHGIALAGVGATTSTNGVEAGEPGQPYLDKQRQDHGGGTANSPDTDLRLLCVHQTVEGAQVGPGNYTFRSGADVVRGRDVPPGFAAVLSGHIHRRQVLTHDLSGQPMAAPVFYPGSVERTSFAERDEPKGYLWLEFSRDGEGQPRRAEGEGPGRRTPRREEEGASPMTLPRPGRETWRTLRVDLDSGPCDVGASGGGPGWTVRTEFRELPARPMVNLVLQTEGRSATALAREVRGRLRALPPDAVVRIALCGPPTPEAVCVLRAAKLREWAPPSMNVSVAGSAFREGISPPRHQDTKNNVAYRHGQLPTVNR